MKDINHLVETNDGSSTLKNELTGDLYHSIHGAETESQYVFIENGLKYCTERNDDVSILEVGLGTGLNALLTFVESLKMNHRCIKYTTLEPLPIEKKLIQRLNFKALSNKLGKGIFEQIHDELWNQTVDFTDFFTFNKRNITLQEFETTDRFDLIYYDAFGPTYQPEMWEKHLLSKVVDLMNVKGILVTYCAKGEFRRNIEFLGLEVERLPGPPGKREMIRAIKC